MVKRYPHKAIVVAEIDGEVINGEWVEGYESTIEIAGRLDPISTNDVVRINSQGNEVIVRGEFFTQQKKIDGVDTISIAELDIENVEIICWWDFQTHSIISI